jgi:biopolymer transport protein ExbD
MKTTQIFPMTAIATSQQQTSFKSQDNTVRYRRGSLNKTQKKKGKKIILTSTGGNRSINNSSLRNKNMTTRITNRSGSTEGYNTRNLLNQNKHVKYTDQNPYETSMDLNDPNPFKNK